MLVIPSKMAVDVLQAVRCGFARCRPPRIGLGCVGEDLQRRRRACP